MKTYLNSTVLLAVWACLQVSVCAVPGAQAGLFSRAEPTAGNCPAAMALKLNQDTFRIGDRFRLHLDNSAADCQGPWDIYLALLPHADRPAANEPDRRRYLPEWSRTRQPAKSNVRLRQGLIEIMDVVVEENLPAGKHRVELILEAAGRKESAITLTKDFVIQAPLSRKLEVVVDLGASRGPVKSLTGFLHGVSPKEHDAQVSQLALTKSIAETNPAYWRLNNEYVYRTARPSGAAITLVLGDLLEQEGVKPWEIVADDNLQWQKLEQRVRAIIRRTRDSGMRADYWDLWNEPDKKTSWGGSVEQFLEFVSRVAPVIRAEDPRARIVAPSTSDNFGRIPDFWERFVDYVATRKIRIDAISWHEFHRPEDIPDTAHLVRERIKAIPGLSSAELHVNEYGGGQNHLLPGWQLGWLYYLDKAEVDWANHACWYWPRGEGRDVSECIRGLDGLLHPATLEPLPAYWVNYWQGRMAGERLTIALPAPRIVALGAYDRTSGEIQVVLGRYSCGQKMKWCRFNGAQVKDEHLPAEPLTLVFKGFPPGLSTASVTVLRAPGQTADQPLLQPEPVSESKLAISGGTAEIVLREFRDGDVYHVKVSK